MKAIFPVNHYELAKSLLAEGDTSADRNAVAVAQVHATLYVGDQLEALVGLFATTARTAAKPSGPDELTREEAGLT